MNYGNHVTLNYSNEVRQICNPLFELLDIEHFMITFYYSDNSIARLSTCSEWTKNYFHKGYYNVVPTLNLNESPKSYSVWDYLDEKHKPFLEMLNEAKDFKISNGLTIIKNYKDFRTVCSICSPRKKKNNDLYISNLSCVDSFISYFLNKASPLISIANKNRIYVKSTDIHNNENKLQNFYQSITLNKVYFKNILLSKQETLCLLYSMLGKTSKKISKIMDISPRTVDTYINNIKIKTNCIDRTSMIEEAFQSEVLKGILFEKIPFLYND